MSFPNWRIQIVKSLGMEVWSNDWLTDDVLMLDAQDLANELIAFEKSIHTTDVLFQYCRISSMIENDRVFRHFTINLPGLVGAGDYLPLYCTVRMDMSTEDSDPCRKYFRIPVKESDQTNGAFLSGYMSTLGASIISGLATPGVLSHIVSGKGNSCDGAAIFPRVQMRQLNRRRRKPPVVVP